jgi:putative sugar O-methyltransferase
VLARLEEPELGNPIRVWRDGRLVSQDLVNSVRERNTIVAGRPGAEADPSRRVAELGAGYGRLGYVLLSTTNWRYFVFDIPPALYISEWYLPRLFPERRVFRFRPFGSYEEIAAELEDAQIAFFTANQLAAFPEGYFDVFATISSLHEMRPAQIAHFLGLMASRTREALYLKQHGDYVNPWDDLRIRRADYRLPPRWRVAWEGLDVVNPGFFELLARREGGSGS